MFFVVVFFDQRLFLCFSFFLPEGQLFLVCFLPEGQLVDEAGHLLQCCSFPLVKSGLLLGDSFQVLRGVAEPGHSSLLLKSCQALLETCLPASQNLSAR